MDEIEISEIDVKDIRFPTSLQCDGSDAMVKYNEKKHKFI